MATPQQIVNGQVATCLYYCWTKLEKVGEEHAESAAALVKPGVKVLIFLSYKAIKVFKSLYRAETAHHLRWHCRSPPNGDTKGTRFYHLEAPQSRPATGPRSDGGNGGAKLVHGRPY